MNFQPQVVLSTPAALLQATQRLLRPLARLLMAFGMNYPAFANLAKGVFVDVAARDFPDGGVPVSDSQVSILSGVHRREVKRLRADMLRQDIPPAVVSLGGQIVARWCSDERFLDGQHRPAPLPRLASKGGDVSFEKLVEGVSKDIRARAVLEEWLRLGVAYLDGQDRVNLVEHAFIPTRGLDEKAFFMGKNLSDHMSATAHNLMAGQPPFLERCVYYDGLHADSVEKLRILTRELAVSALQEVNRRALELQQKDSGAANSDQRMTFGVYFYAEATDRPQREGGK